MFKRRINVSVALLAIVIAIASGCRSNQDTAFITLKKGAHIILVGNNLGSRMMNYDYFETELQLRYPDSFLYVRNMCDGGNTPGFRPHSARNTPWAFPGAEKF